MLMPEDGKAAGRAQGERRKHIESLLDLRFTIDGLRLDLRFTNFDLMK